MTRRGRGVFHVYHSGKLQITIAVGLLYQHIRKTKSAVTVNGLKCTNRVMALRVVFEHEITQLIENLLWAQTSCSKRRFNTIACSVFGNTEYVHKMLTTDKLAVLEHGIGLGAKVSFSFKGQEYRGFVNRITKRATVLAEYPEGYFYNDGHRYKKYPIPLYDLNPAP